MRALAASLSAAQLCLTRHYQDRHIGRVLYLLFPAVPAPALPLPGICGTWGSSCTTWRNKAARWQIDLIPLERKKQIRSFFAGAAAVWLCGVLTVDCLRLLRKHRACHWQKACWTDRWWVVAAPASRYTHTHRFSLPALPPRGRVSDAFANEANHTQIIRCSCLDQIL